jgi:hypothetical protein
MCLLVLALGSYASAEWKEKVLYSFQGGVNDGSLPAGGVVFDSQGNLYGATTDGGLTACAIGGECGTVFQLSPPLHTGDAWTETVIYRFRGQAVNDGGLPNGGLIIDAAGNLYGVNAYGGSGDCVLLGLRAGCGTVYKLSPPEQKGGAWKETILYSFPTAKQGYLPNGNLLFDKAGNLYGATTFGGTKGTTCDAFYGGQCGVVFEVSPPKAKLDSWTERVLHNFAGGKDGANPNGGLAMDAHGAIYGLSSSGGTGGCESSYSIGCGTAFRLVPPGKKNGAWKETVIYSFQGTDGATPLAGLTLGRYGVLYGTTEWGGAGAFGTAFELVPNADGSWTETSLHSFDDGFCGGLPTGSLALHGKSGSLYGTTTEGGVGDNHYGAVFRLSPPIKKGDPWTIVPLYTFYGRTYGAGPAASVVFDQTGNLYSTTTEGGTGTGCSFRGCGTVFEVSP